MQIIIEVQEQPAIDAVVAFSKRCRDATDGNVSWLEIIGESFANITGCRKEDVTIREIVLP